MALVDPIIPKEYRNGQVLFEQNLDKWRLKVQSALADVNLNLYQIAKDTFLPGYDYDNDGLPNYGISIEARLNQLLGGGADLTGTKFPSWTINSAANSARMTTTILTAPRTYQFPDVSGTFLLNFATQVGSNIGINQTVSAGGSPFIFNLAGGAHTNLTASTEMTDLIFNLARTVQWATGNFASQRFVRFQAPTISFVAASTITDAATVYISGAPIAGANATLTNTWALWIDSGDLRLDGNLVLTGDITTDGNLVWKSGTAFTGTLDHANTANRIWTLPDIAGAILIDAGVQTVTGAKTFASNTFLLGGAGAGIATIIYANTATSRTYTVPDAGAAADFVMTEGAQTLNGPKTLVSPVINTSINMSAGNVTVALNNSTNALNFNTNHLVLDATNKKVSVGTAPTTDVGTGGFMVLGDVMSEAVTAAPQNAGRGYLNSQNGIHMAGGGASAGGMYVNTGDYNVTSYTRNAAGDYTVTMTTQTLNSNSKAFSCNINSPIVGNNDGAIITGTTTTTVSVGTLIAIGTAQDSDYSVCVIGAN